jgi:hypothetical protein
MHSCNNSNAGGLGGGKSGKKPAEKKKDPTDGPALDKCLNCGKNGHWAKDCWSKLNKAKAHVAQIEEEEGPCLFLASVGDFFPNTSALEQGGDGKNSNNGGVAPGKDSQPTAVREYLRLGVDETPDQKRVEMLEEHVFAQIDASGEHRNHQWWILDMGATIQMTRARKAFLELDFRIRGSVKFGDGSVIEIEGRNTILFIGKGGEHRWLTGVYFILCLKVNIVSLEQLEEGGCHIYIEHGFLKICDENRWVLTWVSHNVNRLYFLELTIEQPVHLTARVDESSWKWHARFRHLNFPALQKLFRGDMVCGLPTINEANRLCDSCITSKQRRVLSPFKSSYVQMKP